MTPATLGEIANLGHEEKQAMREYTKTRIARPNPSAQETATHHVGDLEIAFLQGILWERRRWTKPAGRIGLISEPYAAPDGTWCVEGEYHMTRYPTFELALAAAEAYDKAVKERQEEGK